MRRGAMELARVLSVAERAGGLAAWTSWVSGMLGEGQAEDALVMVVKG